MCRFGDEYVPGNLLTGFGFFEPYWLVLLANLAIVIHLFGGYQVSPQAPAWHHETLKYYQSTSKAHASAQYILPAIL